MRKIFLFVAAMIFAFAANAATVNISAGDQTLASAVNWNVSNGDTIVMGGGEYTEPYDITMNKVLVVKAAEGVQPVIKMGGYFSLQASVKFEGIKFMYNSGDGYCMYFRQAADSHDCLILENCEFEGFTYYAITSWEDFHVDSIVANNCYFHNLAKGPFYLKASGRSDLSNTCDKLKITNCTFEDIDINSWVSVIDLRNNDGDSWQGNNNELLVDHCTFYNIHGEYNRIIMSYKSPSAVVSNCIIAQPEDNQFYPTYNYGGQILNNLTFNTKSHRSGPTATDNITGDPLFEDAANGDLTLKEGSPAIGAGTDGSNLGDPRWWPAKTIYFKAEQTWWNYDYDNRTAPGVYAWADGVAANASWPGVRMEKVEGEDFVWKAEIAGRMTNIIFTRCNGTGDIVFKGVKTVDLTIPEDDKDMYTMTLAEIDWSNIPSDGVAEGEWGKYAPYVQVLEDGFYLIGKFGGVDAWTVADLTAAKKFEWNKNVGEGNEEWKVVADLAEGDKVKACYVYHDAITSYTPDGEGNEYVVDANHAGSGKTIYFQQLYNNEWGGHFWIDANEGTGLNNINAVKVVKMIENGQLVIIKNGVRYNAQGAIMK